jgi:hypothetical protein
MNQNLNLVLLVEGDTEQHLYASWLHHRVPGLTRVPLVVDLLRANYVLINGKGSQLLRNLAGLLRDIHEYPGRVTEFWVCVDSEEETYESRLHYLTDFLNQIRNEIDIEKSNPELICRIIVQHCCIETWLLGHAGFLRQGPQGRDLVEFKRFFDISTQDPEAMGTFPGYITRASSHEAYLKAMFRERGHSYSKQHPGVAREANYLDALEQRCRTTQHLRSLSVLFAGMAALPPVLPAP